MTERTVQLNTITNNAAILHFLGMANGSWHFALAEDAGHDSATVPLNTITYSAAIMMAKRWRMASCAWPLG